MCNMNTLTTLQYIEWWQHSKFRDMEWCDRCTDGNVHKDCVFANRMIDEGIIEIIDGLYTITQFGHKVIEILDKEGRFAAEIMLQIGENDVQES